MVEEITKDLLKRYNTLKVVLAAKWLSKEMDGNESDEEDTYDVPLLTIYFKDLSEDVPIENRLLQIRVRNIYGYQEVVMVFNSTGASKKTVDIESDLREAASYAVDFTEKLLLELPDAIYRYEWYGDEETIKPEE